MVKKVTTNPQKEAYLLSLSLGTTRQEAAEAAGISVTAVWKWRRKDKEFAQREEDTLLGRIQVVEDALFKSATGGAGKNNVVAQIFWLKNRGKNWKDKQELEFSVPKIVKQTAFVQAGKEPVIKEEKVEEIEKIEEKVIDKTVVERL